MKRKTIAFLVVMSLLALPVMASAAAEFSLGGYIKLHMFWDSARMGKNWNTVPARNSDQNLSHGRFQMTSQSSRFNFTIKGPEVFGAKTTGYLEMDFDANENRQSASNSWSPRLRHAFFRMNWPDWELLMGQYWSYFCEFYPEMIQDGPFQGHGQATHRLPQIRGTYAFGPGWTKEDKMSLSLMVGAPTDVNDSGDPVYLDRAREGQTSETPQVQGKVSYEADLWGKAGFYGRPRAFTAQVCAGWQRTRYRGIGTGTVDFEGQQYLNNWAVQGTLFLPIIPTATKNLAGSAALSVQGYVGQGLGFIGNETGFNSYVNADGTNVYLTRTWGGYVQGNYYFTNEWFMNVAAGLGNNFGVSPNDFNNGGSFIKTWYEIDANLYYRPVTALKFGLGYAYTSARYYGESTPTVSNNGEVHRVQFAGWLFF